MFPYSDLNDFSERKTDSQFHKHFFILLCLVIKSMLEYFESRGCWPGGRVNKAYYTRRSGELC